ncbi:MAG: 3'-5' exonuclease, partial [Proteobacteria bacterium]|nr:3'-5' exonuclease [Pseudomonadota bacterium]
MSLGRWAVIDIETTGINPADDAIIDLGFWQFEDLKLQRKFTSLVRTDIPLSPFIQKLTGISQKMVKNAPLWSAVEHDLLELEKHQLIAHNSAFEEKFLKRYFDKVDRSHERESFQDSILYLALIFPDAGQLNLESFIRKFGIAEKEEHRGEADARDLLKVMIAATAYTYTKKALRFKLMEVLGQFEDDFFFKKFARLSLEDLTFLASECEFDLTASLEHFRASEQQRTQDTYPDAKKMPRKFSGEVIR